uniref:Fibronectin type-III domain-containing protein n=1 Tax=Amphimedon queenslandica TaxID=400682 RepID=A0A1X7UUL9_AMPQE
MAWVTVLALSFLFYFIELTHCANITLQPVSINTTLNSTVVFSCEATADALSFRVNNLPDSNTDVTAKGFSVTSSGTGTIRAELEAIAYEHNNNTEINCTAITLSPLQAVTSNTVVLTIQGLLDSVVDLDYTFINGSSVLLTWTAPYTLDNVPITGYYIVNGLVNITATNKSIILSATNPDPCILNNVSVSPINDVGIGSSNNISFYYETVPLITPPVSVVPVIIDGQLISLNISINVSVLCIGEYPNSITVNILNTDSTVVNSASIPTQVNDQLMITGVITVPNNLNTFIVNVSFSNLGGELLPTPSFGFGKVGPVTNINSSIDNCSTIDITWTAPTVDDRVSILLYILRIYDAITGSLVTTVSVDDTSYQFMDNNLFIHRYTYVITGVNELGEGISNNDTFSYQRVPRSVKRAVLCMIAFNQTSANVSFNIPVIVECTGEAPGNATVTIQCNGTGVVYTDTILVGYAIQPMNITVSVLVPLYQQCNITFIVSNGAGSSEPFILPFVATILPTTSSTSVSSTLSPTVSTIASSSVLIMSVAAAGGLVVLLVIIIFCCLSLRLYHKKKLRNERKASESHGLLNERISFDGSSARSSIGSTTEETKLSPSQSTNSNEPPANTTKEATTGGAAAKEPIYSDLGVAPATTKLAKPEALSVEYADIDKIVPRSKATAQPQSYDDVVVSASGTTVIGATGGDSNLPAIPDKKSKRAATTGQEGTNDDMVVSASGTTVIGATGGDTNPPPIPDKKSKGAATTGQEGTNGETDAARNLPHHVNDDSHFPSPPPPPRPPHPHPPRPPPPPPHSPPPGSGEGGVQPGFIAADQATAIVSYL